MNNWKEIILAPNDTMKMAIQTLDREALKIVMVANQQGQLVGTVTDGDIRRALIRHEGMDSHIENFMFKTPTVASIDDSKETILSMMKSKELLQVPIIDSDRMIVGLETLQRIIERVKLENPVFLMAGGFGKRLRPLTNNIPKPLLKVGTKPILETILEQFIDAGFYNFYISTHYKAEMVRKHFGDGGQWGVNIQYVHEETPLGTAGALGLLPKTMPDLPILMMNGDLLTKVSLDGMLQFHNEHNSVATMCVREYDFQVPYGVVTTEEHLVTGIIEKPIHKFFVNAGIYVLSPSLVKSVEGSKYLDMPQLLEQQIEKGSQVNMFPVHEYWLDIGRIEEFERANQEISI